MRNLSLAKPGERLSVLCLGAHSDDIEIGVGATLLTWVANGIALDVRWAVLSAAESRAAEARASATDFMCGARCEVEFGNFKDGFFPYQGTELKTWFEALKTRINPDVIFTHCRDDAHQDHREVSRLTANSFRDHLTLEYEIPKWDGDLGQPNLFIPVSDQALQRKIDLLERHFASQRSKDWFDADTFRGLARLRGMECRSPSRFAEAFHVRKMSLG